MPYLRLEAADARQLRRFLTEDGRERHAMNVAARRGVGCVHVTVRIDPDKANRRASGGSSPIRRSGHGSSGKAMVAAEHDRYRIGHQRFARSFVDVLTDLRNL